MCNDLMNWITLISSVVAAIGSIAAVIASVSIAHAQKRISLLSMRIQILNDIDTFVSNVLPKWEWDGNLFPINRYTEKQIEVLFDSEFATFFSKVLRDASRCNMLKGDENTALNHGECKGKTADKIEQERMNIENALADLFKIQKDRAYEKWIKV